jgi:hypothetical protein
MSGVTLIDQRAAHEEAVLIALLGLLKPRPSTTIFAPSASP